MAILRKENRANFTMVSNDTLRDERLSLRDLGILVRLISLPDNWEFSENGLMTIFKQDGQTSIRSGLKKLEECGYLSRERRRDERGRVSGVEWIVRETVDAPRFENHSLENSNLDSVPQQKPNKPKTDEANTNGNEVSKKGQRISFDELIDAYTENDELRKALREYIQMRTAIRKKITNRGLELAFNTLDKLANNEAEKVAIVNQSIMNSWQGLFALKVNSTYKNQNQPPKDEDNEAVKKARDKWGDLPGFKIV